MSMSVAKFRKFLEPPGVRRINKRLMKLEKRFFELRHYLLVKTFRRRALHRRFLNRKSAYIVQRLDRLARLEKSLASLFGRAKGLRVRDSKARKYKSKDNAIYSPVYLTRNHIGKLTQFLNKPLYNVRGTRKNKHGKEVHLIYLTRAQAMKLRKILAVDNRYSEVVVNAKNTESGTSKAQNRVFES